MNITLYTTHCPKCEILEKKLQQKNIKYTICDDVNEMQKLNIDAVPVIIYGDLEKIQMDFKTSVDWLNKMEVLDGND